MVVTEVDACPLTGDRPDGHGSGRWERNPNPIIQIPGNILPATTTDAEAEHERAMIHAYSWSRDKNDGRVYLWVEM